jgi:hypothetical protein
MKLLIETQYYENYAAPDWDGKGACPEYWKPKGGQSFLVMIPKGYPLSDVFRLVEAVRSKLEWDNMCSRSSICSWEVVTEDYMTDDERMQMEFEGRVSFPTKVMTVAVQDYQ